ncbi:MAG: SipW-dependent-type signal peptide-containing protein [Christensenellaceae bacterium]
MKKKTLLLLLALVLVIGGVIGGSLAWLTDTTNDVVNIFTTSGIDITLEESEDLDLTMVPGYTIEKDPMVTVLDGSEDCWLFVKLEKSANFDNFLSYVIADGWTQGDGTNIPSNVFYRAVMSEDAVKNFGVLKDDEVTVLCTVTQAMMEALNVDIYPKLTVTAYASQYYKNNTEAFSAAEAWANIGN